MVEYPGQGPLVTKPGAKEGTTTNIDIYRRIQLLEKQKDDLAKRLDEQGAEIEALKGLCGGLMHQLQVLIPNLNALAIFVQDQLGQIPVEYFEKGLAMAQGKEVAVPKIKVVPGGVKLN